ncbi:hypothetical protein UR09_03925 [Candidatus Nitromaritima sp. SCGC AAA799-A02]|nr:hypothetical protein UR09_03925 [Candidatus Nitromaritima sp. SCGC AAA799-A02]
MDSSKFSWFHIGFHNLADSYVNFQVGKLSPVDFTPYSDRLRIWQTSAVMNVNASPGSSAGENSTNVRSSRPGIQYYGYKGPFTWFAGVDNGKDATDPDNAKNFWVGLKLEVPESVKGSFVGSSVGYHYYDGTDNAATATAQITNNFSRHTFATNIRYDEDTDIQAVVQLGNDKNGTLGTTATETDFHGFTVAGAHRTGPWWYVLQYDNVNSSDVPAIEFSKISPSAWYFLRDNFKVGVVARIDVNGGPVENHEAAVEIRTMF